MLTHRFSVTSLHSEYKRKVHITIISLNVHALILHVETQSPSRLRRSISSFFQTSMILYVHTSLSSNITAVGSQPLITNTDKRGHIAPSPNSCLPIWHGHSSQLFSYMTWGLPSKPVQEPSWFAKDWMKLDRLQQTILIYKPTDVIFCNCYLHNHSAQAVMPSFW